MSRSLARRWKFSRGRVASDGASRWTGYSFTFGWCNLFATTQWLAYNDCPAFRVFAEGLMMHRRDVIAGLLVAATFGRAQAQQTGKVYRIALAAPAGVD